MRDQVSGDPKRAMPFTRECPEKVSITELLIYLEELRARGETCVDIDMFGGCGVRILPTRREGGVEMGNSVYTYAADMIRGCGALRCGTRGELRVSRREASVLIGELAKALNMPKEELATKLAEYHKTQSLAWVDGKSAAVGCCDE